MEFTEYKNLVGNLKVGKNLPNAIYLHESALKEVPYPLLEFLQEAIAILKLDKATWNIIKFSKKEFKFSLLNYPDFFTDSYPVLKRSYTIDLNKFSYRKVNYSKSKNPPILHRKETFLLQNHPAVPKFQEITKEGEEAGLYENSRTIGFKKTWESLINKKGYSLVKGRLRPVGICSQTLKTMSQITSPSPIKDIEIERHKTAIDRNSLSAPMQSLFRHDYLQGDYSLFDYGCGKGDDLNILANHHIDASGWDPVYFPDNEIKDADIVNLGFVLNVIENPQERVETLKKTYSLTSKLLVVAVMLGGETITSKFERYGDGVITSRKTFQKYYFQTEFRDYLQDSLGETALAVGPGIFYVFKDKLEEQRFLVERQRLKLSWQKLSYTDHPERLKVKQRALYERHKELFEGFWQQSLELGRVPINSEFKKSEELRTICSSHQKGITLLTTIYGEEPFQRASQSRRDDLLVYHALGLFGQRKPYKHMPESLQRDIKHFFSNITSAIKEATELLFSLGKPDLIHRCCEQAHKEIGRGRLEESHSLTIHRNDVELLPAELRVYIGCASQLYGDIDTVDLVKIHIRSGKVSLMRYDDFEGKPLPLLLERIKIKLREQAIDFFDYGDKFEPQPLYLKSQFIPQKFPEFAKQATFDKRVQNFSWANLAGHGMSKEAFDLGLDSEGLEIRGFRFYKKKK